MNNTIDNDSLFDAAIMAEVAEEHGYKLIPLQSSPLKIVIDVCILLMMLFMMFEVKTHVINLFRLKKTKIH